MMNLNKGQQLMQVVTKSVVSGPNNNEMVTN